MTAPTVRCNAGSQPEALPKPGRLVGDHGRESITRAAATTRRPAPVRLAAPISTGYRCKSQRQAALAMMERLQARHLLVEGRA